MEGARQRIEEIRKADINIEVNDEEGKPVLAAEVSIKLKKHEFHFGTAMSSIITGTDDISKLKHSLGTSIGKKYKYVSQADCGKYLNISREYFNTITIQNGMKWKWWYKPGIRELTDNTLKWARDHDMDVRGHCVIFPGWRHLPSDLRDLQDEPEQLRRKADTHIRNVVGHYRGSVYEWDVINEPVSSNDLMNVLGYNIMTEWFSIASQYDPSARLIVNEFGILSSRKNSKRRREEYYRIVRDLIEGGAPIGGIGMQGHFKFQDGSDLTDPEIIYEVLDRFAGLEKPIVITEFDINISDETVQADYMRKFMTIVFSHPRVEGITIWGFWEGDVWRPNTALWRRDWSIKPNGNVWINLVHKEWSTDTKGSTDKQGIFRTSGFLGLYEIVIKKDKRVEKVEMRLQKKGANLKVVL